MATDCSSRSKEVYQIYGQETSYRCLHCAKPVCSRSKSCSVATSEKEPGWKPGHAVSICRVQIQSLNLASRNIKLHQREAILQRQRRNKRARALQIPKRIVNVLTFQRKVKSSSLQRKPLTLDQGNLIYHFEIGKTQIQAIL